MVDTAAEEAVIGSTAMMQLREQLARFGLQPAQAPGSTVTCAGIGGSAKIVGVFDIPVGVAKTAKTNGLLRVIEISDEGAFKTPFCCPSHTLNWWERPLTPTLSSSFCEVAEALQ